MLIYHHLLVHTVLDLHFGCEDSNLALKLSYYIHSNFLLKINIHKPFEDISDRIQHPGCWIRKV